MRKAAFHTAIVLVFILVVGFLVPGRLVVPVKGATRADWNPKAFGFYPWGKSGVHKGIDIFAREGIPVIAASSGVVISADVTPDGGNVISILGPKWRIHYYAHLKTAMATTGTFVSQGTQIGTVGTTGNAAGRPSHLHYAIITQIPYIWLYRNDRLGLDRMFYLNPDEQLRS